MWAICKHIIHVICWLGAGNGPAPPIELSRAWLILQKVGLHPAVKHHQPWAMFHVALKYIHPVPSIIHMGVTSYWNLLLSRTSKIFCKVMFSSKSYTRRKNPASALAFIAREISWISWHHTQCHWWWLGGCWRLLTIQWRILYFTIERSIQCLRSKPIHVRWKYRKGWHMHHLLTEDWGGGGTSPLGRVKVFG
jgi:hypothetical protein